ncbi:MAG: right-handed parallel beta-helix repeat-containing protein, partial [Dehalococcoidia bacterium]|nr:right-handed parallel beta-helix repeat-containing protein [Dehalococcoidia bacterium]
GVYVYDNGQGTLEDNDIFGNALTGVAISEGGNPTLRRNRINKNSYEAVWVYKNGSGTIEDNDLRENARGAWDISPDCQDKVTRRGNQE